ncbi:hypothetical protein J8L88_02620 [Aquimarina sp. MMG015]|uniref:hypothetical protein n=1 Tax=Aquimarina sp. MMG015 TaxID=2822689 RepID=UPI001B39D91A|nr:hypothetical protein [Aquimarina sp. MMG015]MBQ4801730.1 hypothetical protein [Aquimarina sp. MMG015]
MNDLNKNELLNLYGGNDDCNSDAYNNGHEIGEAIGEFLSFLSDIIIETSGPLLPLEI